MLRSLVASRRASGALCCRAYSTTSPDNLRAMHPSLTKEMMYRGGPLRIGHWRSLSKTMKSQDIVSFSEVSEDRNPIHLHEEYAAGSIFKRRIAHGFLSASLISAVAGTQLPGAGTIYLNQQLSFRKPVYIDDTVTAVVRVLSVRPLKKLVELETNCYNQNHELVISGQALVKVDDDKIDALSDSAAASDQKLGQ